MPDNFYNDLEYRRQQSERTKKYWESGLYNSLKVPLQNRTCKNSRCTISFQVKPSNPKIYCSNSCAARVNNLKRVYLRKSGICLTCDKKIARYCNKYCSIKCQAQFNYDQYIKDWKMGLKSGNIGITTRVIASPVRKYIWNKYKGRCSKCNWHKKHPISNKVPLEINHIDGNANNNKENNLELICPNCHSLTSNFRNLNKGNGRKWRLDKIHNNLVLK